jgi:hypothetical protein
MEQRFRFVVIDRKITQGTRGQAGRSWCERIWTVLATCAQRGRSAYLFLQETINAFLEGRTLPTLVLNSSYPCPLVPEHQHSPHSLHLSSHRFTAVITAKHPR